MNRDMIVRIAESLRQSGEVEMYSGHSDPIEQELAYDICEIVESMETVLKTQWPEILGSESPEDVSAALSGFREELRHILYHVENSMYFSLICAPKNADGTME